ncbi:DUF2057 family protein [Neptuniibacter sp. QD72_48]|uniref:YccT family protein n=1 Tax=unclassified Neptuniibacter TaxID=2630693 RepID=UPI0039F515DE
MKPLNNILLTALTAFSLIASNYSYADNTLLLEEGVNLIAVNGSEVNSDKLFNGRNNYKLPNGSNQILVNYTAEVKKSGDFEIEKSKAFVLLFESNNSQISLAAPVIERIKDLEKFEQNKNWILKNSAGQNIPFKVNIIEKDGFQLSRDFEEELEKFNQSNAIASLPKRKITLPYNTNNKQTKNSVIKKESMTMEMLIYWYNQADLNTRNSFKELIKNK